MTGRFREIDGLRGLAAMGVLLSHFTGAYNSRYTDDPLPSFDFEQGAFGVQLFFIISGFVILMSATRTDRPSDFVISRVSRLYPAFWLSLIFAIIVNRVFLVPPGQPTIVESLLNFTMIQRWFQVPNVNDVYWTLAVEMQFYVIVFVLLLLTRSRLTDRVITIFVSLWLLVALTVAVWASPFSWGVDPQHVVTPVKVVLNLTLAEYGPLFCLGMLSYLARRDGKFRVLIVPSAVIAVAVAALLVSWESAFITAGICLGFLLIALRRRTGWLLFSPLQWFGKISYSLYIVHGTVGYVLIRLTWPYVGRDGAMIVAFVGATLVAWALYIAGEKYGSGVLKRALIAIRMKRLEPIK